MCFTAVRAVLEVLAGTRFDDGITLAAQQQFCEVGQKGETFLASEWARRFALCVEEQLPEFESLP